MSKQSTKRPPRRKPSPAADHRAIWARRLDLLADLELQHGHHVAAEQLARQAQAMREDRA